MAAVEKPVSLGAKSALNTTPLPDQLWLIILKKLSALRLLRFATVRVSSLFVLLSLSEEPDRYQSFVTNLSKMKRSGRCFAFAHPIGLWCLS